MRIFNKFETYDTYLTLNEMVGGDNIRDTRALNKFRKCFTLIITNYKFFAELLFNLKVVEVHAGSKYKTMATDGKILLYNPDFVNKLTEAEVIFVIIHELMHCANLHFARSLGREQKLWNCAADYAINLQIDDMRKDLNSNTLATPKDILLDEKYRNMSAEQIYDELYENRPPEEDDEGKFTCPKCGGEITDVSKIMVTGKAVNGLLKVKCPHCGHIFDIDVTIPDSPPPPGGQPGVPPPPNVPLFCPACGEEIKDPGDHITGQANNGMIPMKCPHCGHDFEVPVPPPQGGNGGSRDENDDDPWVEDGKGLGDGEGEPGKKAPPVTGEDIADPGTLEGEGETVYEGNTDLDKMSKNEVKDAWKKIRVDAVSNSRGTGSASFDRWLRKTTKPKVNWKAELKKFVTQIFSEVNYGFFNKRFIGDNDYLPGLKKVDKSTYDNVIIAIDTSGSINDVTLGKFGAELESLFKRFKIKKCYIIWCDAEIKSVQTFDMKKNKFKLERLVPKGGGGTSFFPPFVWIQKNIIKKGKTPAFFIYFTDAYGDAPKPSQYAIRTYQKRILWVITENDDAKNLTYGKKIYLDNI